MNYETKCPISPALSKKMRACSHLLPDPGGEVVRECLDSVDQLTSRLAQAEGLLRSLVTGIDEWNKSMELIINRPVDYRWGSLEEARAFLAEGGATT